MVKLLSHIMLSVLLLLSATGLTVNMHYCHDQFVDMALFVPADSCCESGIHESNTNHGEELSKPDHCKDMTLGLESTNDYVVSPFSFNQEYNSFELFFTSIFTGEKQKAIESSVYTILSFKKPPTYPEVVLSQIQTYLI